MFILLQVETLDMLVLRTLAACVFFIIQLDGQEIVDPIIFIILLPC